MEYTSLLPLLGARSHCISYFKKIAWGEGMVYIALAFWFPKVCKGGACLVN